MAWEDVAAKISFISLIPPWPSVEPFGNYVLGKDEKKRIMDALFAVYDASPLARGWLDQIAALEDRVVIRGGESGSWYLIDTYSAHRILIDFDDVNLMFLSNSGRVETMAGPDEVLGLGLIVMHELLHALGYDDPVTGLDRRFTISDFDHIGEVESRMAPIREELGFGARGSYKTFGPEMRDYLLSLGSDLHGRYDQALYLQYAEPSQTGYEDFTSETRFIDGRPSDDLVVATGNTARIRTGGGNDKVFGTNGQDTIYGGEGNDTLHAGYDLPLPSGKGDIYGGAGNDSVFGGAQRDDLYGDGGRDTLDGGGGIDALFGGEGRDVLRGGDMTDYLSGGEGVDRLFGGDGSDVLFADGGSDVVFGGAGADYFEFVPTGPATARVLDFEAGADILIVSLAGSSDLSGLRVGDYYRARFSDVDGLTYLHVDRDGAGTAAGWVRVAQLEGIDRGDALQVAIQNWSSGVTGEIIVA